MRWLRQLRARVRSLFRRRAVEAELDDEWRFHLEQQIAENLAAGMTPHEARLAARRLLGDVEQRKEECRDMRQVRMWEDLWRDGHYALRTLARQPLFTGAAVLSLALGIGAACAVFSMVDGILLRPLDTPQPERVVRLSTSTPAQRFSDLSFREFEAFRTANRTLSGLAAEVSSGIAVQIAEGELPRMTIGLMVNHGYFATLGAQPAQGRGFLPEEDSPAAGELAVLISHGGWQRWFGGRSPVTGRRIKLNGQPGIIVGLLPESFTGTDLYTRPEFYVPLAMAKRLKPALAGVLDDPKERGIAVRGRLRPGVSVAAAGGDLAGLLPASEAERTVAVLRDLDQRLQQKPEDTMLSMILGAIVLLVLLIATVNVANLLLGRATARRREMGIRLSIGAGRFRLIRQLLTESLLLGLLGAGAGVLLAQAGIRYLRAISLPTDYPVVLDVRLDGRVLTCALLLALFTSVVFGLAPALQATRTDLVTAVHARFRGRWLLVAAQCALSVLLLICAGLFAKSFYQLAHAGPGFQVDNVLIASFAPNSVGMEAARVARFYRDIQARVSALPGVESVALAQHVKLGTETSSRKVTVEGFAHPQHRGWDRIQYNQVSAGYFATLQIPLREGRALDERDQASAPRTAVINETMAQRYWPNQSALGRRFQLTSADPVTVEVVGIARNTKYDNMLEPRKPYFYLAAEQFPGEALSLHIRTARDPLALVPFLRREVKALAPELPVYDIRSLREAFENKGLLAARIMAQMIGLMGVMGLLIAVVGLYALLAFLVERRRREIGIRMALGASAARVSRMILASGMKLILAGLATGLAAAALLTGALTQMLEGVTPRDPWIFGGAMLILLLAGLLAGWLPARQAASIAPATTLRNE
ncbi:MAG: ABC transporter permease [Bryobacteraceae bacterium]|nr:ABC transporter permease [Bryobacteraceae bacterium]